MKTLTTWRRSGIVLLAAVALVGILVFVVYKRKASDAGEQVTTSASVPTEKAGGQLKPDKTSSAKEVAGRAMATDAVANAHGEGSPAAGSERTPEDREQDAVLQKLDDALDDDNVEKILQEARKLKQHPDAEVRSRVAFALSWIGLSGLSELTTMLADPDPEVAMEVLDHWRTSLSEVESDTDKALMLSTAAKMFGEDISGDVLSDIVMECSMLDNEAALPQLAVILQTVTKPEQKTEVIDAIHMCMNELEEEPSENEAELLQQIQKELAILAAQRMADEADQALLDQQQKDAAAASAGSPPAARPPVRPRGLPGLQ